MTENATDTANETATDTATETGNRSRWIALAVGVVIVALIGVLAVGGGDSGPQENEVLGQRVPDVSGETLGGERYDIDDARGRWVVVNFFATWCPGCILEHPELVAFDAWAERTGQAEVVSIVFNDPPEVVEEFFTANGGEWPVLDEPRLPVEFHVSQIPETFLVSPSGLVVQHVQGEVEAQALINVIEENSP